MIVNIKASKQDFVTIIEHKLSGILAKVDTLDLSSYRFINITNNGRRLTCYYKGYKTKKDVFEV